MDLQGLKELLEKVRRGELPVAEAARTLAELPVQRIADFAQLDGDRALRQGAPEVVFGERKSPEQIGQLVARLRELGQAVLVTRLGPEAADAAKAAAPDGRYDAVSRTFHARAPGPAREPQGVVAVVCAGMEGALPSVVGGLVPRPVIAVPTSVGYGASLGGLAALLAMLNSCAANVSVVNIDNGLGAGFQAALIARAAAGGRTR